MKKSFLSRTVLSTPLSILPIRSARRYTSSRLCDTKITGLLKSVSISISSDSMLLFTCSSSAENGSSSSMHSGLAASMRSIATRCLWPPERWSGYVSAMPSSPYRFSIPFTFSSSRCPIAMHIFSITVIVGKSA